MYFFRITEYLNAQRSEGSTIPRFPSVSAISLLLLELEAGSRPGRVLSFHYRMPQNSADGLAVITEGICFGIVHVGTRVLFD